MTRKKKSYGKKVFISLLLALLGKLIIVLPLAFLGTFIGNQQLLGIFTLLGRVLWAYFGLAFVYYLYKYLT